MSTIFIVLVIWSVAIVAFVSGVALCTFKRIRMLEARVRAPLQQCIDQQADKLRRVQDVSVAHNFFLAGLSHELRTPLSGIQGAVQLLQNTGLNSPQREYTRMISYASATVLEIVDDMLSYSRMQAGQIHIESVPFSVREMIDDMLSLQNIKAQERGIALIRDVSAAVPSRLVGDRGKLNQILLNLIGNAIKFTEEGSVTVSVDIVPDSGHLLPDSGPVHVRFLVRDTGIGMADNELEHVFEPFIQGYAATRDGRQGTGLGLTICQRLVQALGGDIHIESVLDEGTCVTFDLALDCIDVPASTALSFEKGVARPLRSLIVVVVEDDEINRLVCTRYLALGGHHPVAVADERQVQQLMMSSGYVPDVILMDVNLAGQSGVELALQMSTLEHGRWQAVPVIAMSADVSGAAQEQARAGGISVFLPKPFSAEQLYTVLDATVAPTGRDKTVCKRDVPAPNTTRHHSTTLSQTTIWDQIRPSARDTTTIGHAGPDGMAQRHQYSEIALLDETWLAQEIDVLGTKVLFELLNIFRASAATTLQAMNDAVERQDWRATADTLHRLQGSAANLGMRYVVSQARSLQTIALREEGPHPEYMADRINQLEAACHVSADGVRAMLLAVGEQSVALATQGDD